MYGQVDLCTRDSGNMMRWKGQAYLKKRRTRFMKEDSQKIKRKAWGQFNGRMDLACKVLGKTASKKVYSS